MIKTRKGKLTPDQREDIKIRYFSGERTKDLAKEFGVTHGAINLTIKRAGLPVRDPWGDHNKLPINKNAFSTITPESAYWIGFLMTDGCIQGNCVTLQLAKKDKEHVFKFKKFLKSGHKVMFIKPRKENNQGRKNSTAAYRFSFSCKKIVSDLAEYGIFPKKSLTAKVIGLGKDRDFWRGVVDGDGSVILKDDRYPIISLSGGSIEFMEQFREFTIYICNCPKTKINKGKNAYIYSVRGTNAARLAKILYCNPGECLERKHKKSLKAMSYIPMINQYI